MDMLSVRNRMRELGINQRQLAERLGIDQTAVSKLLNGTRGLKAHEAAKLAEYLNLSSFGFPVVRYIPVIGLISAGNWQAAIEQPMGTMPAMDINIPPHAFGVIVEGDSMDRIVADGATIIIDPQDLDLVEKAIYAVMNENGETTVKQFCMNPARLMPVSTNPEHQPIYPGRDIFHIIGRVIWKSERMR